MADEEQLAIILGGPDAWNSWRSQSAEQLIDLREANLAGANLKGVDLGRAYLSKANLSMSDLRGADLRRAALHGSNLADADLRDASLRVADLRATNLQRANLRRADFRGAEFIGADLRRADLTRADLVGADMKKVNLRDAILRGADIRSANLTAASLHGANLENANLRLTALGDADLCQADLRAAYFNASGVARTNFAETILDETTFANIDFSCAQGLEQCAHLGPCILDHRTLQISEALPLGFLRGAGLPTLAIDNITSLYKSPQFYSCFISYSSKDQAFAERLHTDLQTNGVRCWSAPHDMPIGAKILDVIDGVIRLRDKVLLTRIRRMMGQFDAVLQRIRYNNQQVNLNRVEPSWRTRRVNRSRAL